MMAVSDDQALSGPRLPLLVACVFIACYAALILPFAGYMHTKPFAEKIGHFPKVELIQFMAADQKQVVGEALILDVLTYFGGLVEKSQGKVQLPADYQAMSRLLHGSVRLDPYNMDSYYFAQSILVWDVKQIKVANQLLETGMKYRSWDWYLPFYTGFNYAYFLKDYPQAAKYYMRAAELSGNDLFASLAGRYLNEAGQNDLAISYLSTMVRGAKNQAIKKTLGTRLAALEAVRSIARARDAYRSATGRLPGSVEALVQSGQLPGVPADPYGGQFYLEPDGAVKTTSNFASPKKNQ
jgi:tetratricopeptide (TPR) repeat protein